MALKINVQNDLNEMFDKFASVPEPKQKPVTDEVKDPKKEAQKKTTEDKKD
ncbi:SPJ_0845 family protein [Lacticaseibacillus brantae]|uniref:Uncharacterized protein n=1 Tax=Lacticaseibacillus brantae DSM 23927 TaxID=1423727 RepID=A0A0R2AZ20_9LACO|nr:SPJ_0845 family protein [Lacticaseibacillus brantae]KRM72568.1 hypothetical protein FC34_GL000276 [Lacticaseibacillus brantae DSM 23927]